MTMVYSIALLGLLGLAAGTFLAFAAAKFAVKADPREKIIEACLPGINCGACGFPGCSGLAKSIAKGDVDFELCLPGKRSGAPEKVKLLLNMDQSRIDAAWEKGGENPEKALEILLESSGSPKPQPKKPSRPSKDEVLHYEGELKANDRARLIFNILPKIDCGVCGSPGCAAFALEVASKNKTADKCVPGKRKDVEKLASKILEMSETDIKKVVAESSDDVESIREIIDRRF
jgi:electron transport complex protein RnfB